MKSFCVLNRPLDKKVYEGIGACSFHSFGEKIGIASDYGDKSAVTASFIADGVVSAGGVAEIFGCVNESRVPFLAENYGLSAVFYVSEHSLVSVYSSHGKPLAADEEERFMQLISSGLPQPEGNGSAICINSDSAYFSALLAAAGNLDGACADIVCGCNHTKRLLRRVANLAGADFSSKPRFFISSSGLCVSSLDETGSVINHEKLCDICAACCLISGNDVTVSFSSSRSLEKIAESASARLERSFSGGNKMWQKDGLFLITELMRNMAEQKMGLCSLAQLTQADAIVRRNFTSRKSADTLADLISCEEIITDGISVYARLGRGELLLTKCRSPEKYCLEISAGDSETAEELAADITEVLST